MIALLNVAGLAWELQSPFNKPIVAEYAVTVHANVNSEEHEAVFTLRVESKKGSAESVPVDIAWADLLVDGNSVGESPAWTGAVDSQGQLTALSADSDDYRRMLTPFLFSFPNKSVEEKAKFESTWLKPDQMFAPKFSAEVVATEKQGDADLLKVASKLAEKGENGITADGTWWFDSKGKLVKFVVDAKNWIVPMADNSLVTAKIEAKAK